MIDFRWQPSPTDETNAYGQEKEYARQKEKLALIVRNAFDARFENAVLGSDPAASARVVMTVTEAGRPLYADRAGIPGGRSSAGTSQRCGTVEYIVHADGREVSRGELPLDCDSAGRPDYQRAGLRASDLVAGALGH